VGRPHRAADLRGDPARRTATRRFLKELGTDISRILHGEQGSEIFRPLSGPDHLCVHASSTSMKKPGRSGPMASWFRETAITDDTNEIGRDHARCHHS